MNRIPTLVLSLALVALLVSGCRSDPEPEVEEAPVRRVENPQLGLALATVPTGFSLDANQGETLRLKPADPGVAGTVTFVAGPLQEAGVNLPEAVNEQKAYIETQPEGKFLGQAELGGAPTGTAYSTRGRYVDAGGQQVEEIRVLTLHPSGENRSLALVYVYPAGGDARERVGHAMEILGQIEPVAAPAPNGGEAPADGEVPPPPAP